MMYRNSTVISVDELFGDDAEFSHPKSTRRHRIYVESGKWRRRDAKQLYKHKLRIERLERTEKRDDA